MLRLLWLLAALATIGYGAAPHKLLVISVDGLDWRYLRDRDGLKLRIPNLRRLLREGEVAGGVVGVWPTITWPSHTSLITGKRPDQHGILGNRRPKSEGGDYYWTVDLLKVPTLWQVAHQAGLATASITWPVTAGASIDYDLPEYFLRRQGGEMDLAGVESKATGGLVDAIGSMFPSFPQQWIDDRTRTQAVLYLLRKPKPDLILLHLVDLDSEEHDQGPFTRNADAILERTDELIGELLAALSPQYAVALVSDHGFERVDHTANPLVVLGQRGLKADIQPMGGIIRAKDEAGADFLRQLGKDPVNGIGREIPVQEIRRYGPDLLPSAAIFEAADHYMFGPAVSGPYLTPPYEKGNHGFWPTRHDYRSVYVLWHAGGQPRSIGSLEMIDIASRLAEVLGLTWPD